MSRSQNARFTRRSPAAAGEEHPPGEPLARLLAERLKSVGWGTSIPDDWRDAGWAFEARRAGAELEVALAALAPASEWMLQVAPLRGLGLLDALFRRRPSASPDDVLALARAIDEVLKQEGTVSGILWRSDGIPDSGHGTTTPEPGRSEQG